MIVVTGGTGKLGSELRKLLPKALFPTRKELNIDDIESVRRYFSQQGKISCIIHCAAFTSPPLVDKNPIAALKTNIIGTANLVVIASHFKIRLVYVSTDYVFDGERGGYGEDDSVNPVNKYAWSKLGGECAVRMMHDNWAIARCSFGPRPFPYDKAFIDQFTSREPVDVMAEKILRLAKDNFTGIIHLGCERRSVYDYAKSVSPDKMIEKATINDLNFKVPRDTSFAWPKFDELLVKE